MRFLPASPFLVCRNNPSKMQVLLHHPGICVSSNEEAAFLTLNNSTLHPSFLSLSIKPLSNMLFGVNNLQMTDSLPVLDAESRKQSESREVFKILHLGFFTVRRCLPGEVESIEMTLQPC